jgi:DNA-binding transcriptional MerR regulator
LTLTLREGLSAPPAKEKGMKTYTVKQLARLSGVSVRTLHHYDDIGLLKPAFVGENRYRYYGRDELLRLQDILFHRELGVPLKEIARALDHDGRDRLAMLEEHRGWLLDRVQRSRQLIRTIDRTIAALKGNGQMSDTDLYKGFSPEKQAEYEEWLVERYGPGMRERIEAGRAKLAAVGEDGRRDMLAELASIETSLAEAQRSGTPPEDETVKPLIARHQAWVETMWDQPSTLSSYAGLADLYASHADFRSRYEAIAPGFSDWLTSAMRAHVIRQTG